MSTATSFEQSRSVVHEVRNLDVEVHARHGDYFVLEFKNFALSLLTLGIYGAWAKVRRRQFLLRNTQIEGHGFEYDADPKVVLRSRLILVAILIATVVTHAIDPLWTILSIVALVAAFPVALAASLAFNARHTSYRGARFRFEGRLGGAYRSFFGGNLLSAVTGGLGTFAGLRIFLEYLASNLRIGGRPFGFHKTTTPYWMLGLSVGLSSGAVSLLVKLLVAPALVDLVPASVIASLDPTDPTALSLDDIKELIGACVMYVWYMLIFGYARGHLSKLFYEDLDFGNHTFISNITPIKLAWVYLSNAVVIVLSCGLAIPWASLRSYRYRMTTLQIQTIGPLMEGVRVGDHENPDPSDAIGDALVDLGGFDFGI